MKVILDASAAMALAANYAESPLSFPHEIWVPDVFVAEVTNVVWKNHRFLGTGLPDCELLLRSVLGFPDVIVPGHELAREALMLAAAAQQPAYDMFYLALARREAGALYTKDKALRRLAHRYGIQSV